MLSGSASAATLPTKASQQATLSGTNQATAVNSSGI